MSVTLSYNFISLYFMSCMMFLNFHAAELTEKTSYSHILTLSSLLQPKEICGTCNIFLSMSMPSNEMKLGDGNYFDHGDGFKEKKNLDR